jgi:hypothetical protein
MAKSGHPGRGRHGLHYNNAILLKIKKRFHPIHSSSFQMKCFYKPQRIVTLVLISAPETEALGSNLTQI